MSYTVEVEENGEKTLIMVFKKHGELRLRRLPKHLYDPAHYTPRRLAAIANFTESAASAFGSHMTQKLPPANITVQENMTRLTVDVPYEKESKTENTQAYLRSLLPAEVLQDAAKKIGVMPKVTVPLRPRPTPQLRVLLAAPSALPQLAPSDLTEKRKRLPQL